MQHQSYTPSSDAAYTPPTSAERALAPAADDTRTTTSTRLTRAQLARRRRCTMAADRTRRFFALDTNDAVAMHLEAL